MGEKRYSLEEIKDIFDTLNINNESKENVCPVWEVPPIKRGIKISINTKC